MRTVSDGSQHVGASLAHTRNKRFPGPAAGDGADAPLRILPVGGLGEIGMNCMLVGNYDRYIILDAGLMFPDGFEELGMQKVLPDTSFLHKFRDKIEAVIITHGHEDHIGALPWILPALDPATPVFATSFTMALIKRRMLEFGLWSTQRFKEYKLNMRFQAGPFQCQAVRVTHSIPDCCGLFFRCDDGTIVHTGDWKIDETPMDGEEFDRSAFEAVGNEGVTLFMSDSTNVLSPGRTTSEALVANTLMNRVGAWDQGRVIATCFASNIHRMEALKAAADAAGRRMVLLGMSLNVYLEAAFKDGRATFDPSQLLDAEEMEGYPEKELLIVTTGSQAEPRAMLSRAAFNTARQLKLSSTDLLLYSAKMIPGNEKRIMKMLNAIAQRGPSLVIGRGENLHSSGHAHQEELVEVLRLVKPQHFLPVHGEFAFLKEHEQLARRHAGVRHSTVIQNGQMLGVAPLRSRNAHGTLGSMQLLGETRLQNMYNDGTNSSGTKDDMCLEDRVRLANEGLVVITVRIFRNPEDVTAALAAGYVESDREEAAAVDDKAAARRKRDPMFRDRDRDEDGTVNRTGRGGPKLQGDVKLVTRALYVAQGEHLDEMRAAAEEAAWSCSAAAPGWEVERAVVKAVTTVARRLMQKKPDVLVTAVDATPEAITERVVASAATRRTLAKQQGGGADAAAGEEAGGERRARGRGTEGPKSRSSAR